MADEMIRTARTAPDSAEIVRTTLDRTDRTPPYKGCPTVRFPSGLGCRGRNRNSKRKDKSLNASKPRPAAPLSLEGEKEFWRMLVWLCRGFDRPIEEAQSIFQVNFDADPPAEAAAP
jgi:hypothetical protein